MHHTIPVFVTSRSTFDWISLLGNVVGSFVGAAIVLGIERVLNKREIIAKKQAEFTAVQSALNTELDYNIRICSERVQLLKSDSTRPLLAVDLDTTWLNHFSNNYIDYTNEDSRRLYSYLHTANTLVKRLSLRQSHVDGFYVNWPMVDDSRVRIEKANKSILSGLNDLIGVLKIIKDLREGVIVDLEKAKAHPLFTSMRYG